MITLKTNKEEYTRNLRTVSTSPHTLGPLPVPPWYKPSHPTDGKQVGSLRAAQEWERALTNPHPSITARQKKGHVLDGIPQQRKEAPTRVHSVAVLAAPSQGKHAAQSPWNCENRTTGPEGPVSSAGSVCGGLAGHRCLLSLLLPVHWLPEQSKRLWWA